VYSKTQMKNS